MLKQPARKRALKKLAAPAIYANVQSLKGENVQQNALLFVKQGTGSIRVRDQTAEVMTGDAFLNSSLDSGQPKGSFYGIAKTDYMKHDNRKKHKAGTHSGFVACVAGLTTITNTHKNKIVAGTLLRVAVDTKAYLRPLKTGEWYADAKAVTTANPERQMDIILRPAYRYPRTPPMLEATAVLEETKVSSKEEEGEFNEDEDMDML